MLLATHSTANVVPFLVQEVFIENNGMRERLDALEVLPPPFSSSSKLFSGSYCLGDSSRRWRPCPCPHPLTSHA